ncbi:MAG: glycosyltransferase [Lachnospiraceae bacterium]|nr:glycosyltransferase [Lachnospiraceae bacterium]
MKKILFVINTLGQAGAETALMALLNRLDPAQYEVSLYVLTGQGEMRTALPKYVHVLNRRYADCSVLSAEGQKVLRKTVLRALLARGNALRLFPYLCANGVRMLGKRRVQADKLLWRVLSDAGERFDTAYDLAVAYLEGGSTYYVAEHVKAKKKAAFVHTDYVQAGYTRALDRGCYDWIDSIYAVSDRVKEHFIQMYPEHAARVEVFPNILDIERIRRLSAEPGGFTDGYTGTRILSVGRLITPKAFEVSIDAMKLLKEHGRDVRWYVLGEGDQRKKLEEQIKALGLTQDFILAGAVQNPYPYFRQADLYVHASRLEGKSIAIQEAQVMGKPIITSNCSGNREQVEPGVDGLLCELTPTSICETVETLLDDPARAKALGEQAMHKNEQNFRMLERMLTM